MQYYTITGDLKIKKIEITSNRTRPIQNRYSNEKDLKNIIHENP